jgi:hypothetical protein
MEVRTSSLILDRLAILFFYFRNFLTFRFWVEGINLALLLLVQLRVLLKKLSANKSFDRFVPSS